MSAFFEIHAVPGEQVAVFGLYRPGVAQEDVEAFHFSEDCGSRAAFPASEYYQFFHSVHKLIGRWAARAVLRLVSVS